MTASAASLPSRRARLGRYAVWQARDFGVNIAIVTLVIFGLLGVMFVMNLRSMESYLASRHMEMPVSQKLNMFKEIVAMFTTTAPMIAMSGIVSSDRSNGYTRFLFAKPLSPVRYYAQSALVRFVGYLVLGHVLFFAWGFFEPRPAYSWTLPAMLTGLFVAIGGILFLLSVVTKYDGLIVIVTLLVSAIAWDKWEQAKGLKHALIYLLPPMTKIGEIHGWFIGVNIAGTVMEMPFPARWFWWLSAYGMTCLVSGLIILRRLPLSKT